MMGVYGHCCMEVESGPGGWDGLGWWSLGRLDMGIGEGLQGMLSSQSISPPGMCPALTFGGLA